jgi:hypothetical protein
MLNLSSELTPGPIAVNLRSDLKKLRVINFPPQSGAGSPFEGGVAGTVNYQMVK